MRYVQKLFRTAAEKGEKEKLEYLIQLKGITFFKDDWKALHYALHPPINGLFGVFNINWL